MAALLLAGCGDDDENNNNNNNGNKTEHIRIGSILLDKSTLELEVGEESKLQATIAPDNATHKEIRWKSDDERVATVDDNGLVRAVSKGKAVIHVVSADGSKTATCIVTVTQPVEGVSLEKCPSTMVAGSKEQLKASVEPRAANNQALTWTSSNSTVATVDSSGLVSALAAGEVTIVVRSQENANKTKSCTMTVVVPVGGVRIEGCETTAMEPGSERALRAVIEPNNATNEGVTWTSDDTNVATVDEDGVVKAVSAGKAVISATTEDGEKTASCTVVVGVSVRGVSFAACSTEVMTPNQTRQLTAVVAPANATNKNVTWKSSDTEVATVNANGLVTAGSPPLGKMTAVISATTQDGNYTATCAVNVNVPVSSVTIAGCSTVVLTPGNTRQLTATVSPANATNRTVRWTSNNTNVAAVNATTGLVSPGDVAGTATITATVQDGSRAVTATCSVPVTIPVTGVTIGGCPTEPMLPGGIRPRLTATISPYNATNQNVTWTNSNPSVASEAMSVGSGILLYAHNVGDTTFTVRTNDGNKPATCLVKVRRAFIRCFNSTTIFGGGFSETWTNLASSVKVNGKSVSFSINWGGTAITISNQTLRAGDTVAVELKDNGGIFSSENFNANCS